MTTLVLDQGGHSSRAFVFDADGRALRQAQRSVGATRPAPGRVEQDPEELVWSLREAIDEVGTEGDVTRAGLATQRSSIVCWDRTSGEALTPVLSWQDTRAAARLAALEPRRSEIRRRTGLFPNAHYGATKLAWCLEQVPEVRRAAGDGRLAMGPLASFLVFRLTRERSFVVDPANASRTLLLNLESQAWDAALLQAFDVSREHLPEILPTRASFGTLETPGGAVPLELVQGDQPAALFAFGPPRSDTAYVNLGTGAFVQRPVEGELPPLERLLASVVFSEGERSRCVVEGTVNGAGSALRWLAQREGASEIEGELASWLEEVDQPALFLNGVSGLGSPFWTPLTPRFVEGEDGSLAVRATGVLESIVFLVVANLVAMNEALAVPRRLVVSGGLANLDGLCTRLATLVRVPVERSALREATAHGLSHLLTGVVSPDAAPSLNTVFRPAHDDTGQRLRARYDRWRAELARALTSET